MFKWVHFNLTDKFNLQFYFLFTLSQVKYMPDFGIAVVLILKTLFMSDNKSNIGKADRDRISLTDDYELRHWSKRFGVSQDQLKEAVKQAGPMVKNVKAYFDNKK